MYKIILNIMFVHIGSVSYFTNKNSVPVVEIVGKHNII